MYITLLRHHVISAPVTVVYFTMID